MFRMNNNSKNNNNSRCLFYLLNFKRIRVEVEISRVTERRNHSGLNLE